MGSGGSPVTEGGDSVNEDGFLKILVEDFDRIGVECCRSRARGGAILAVAFTVRDLNKSSSARFTFSRGGNFIFSVVVKSPLCTTT